MVLSGWNLQMPALPLTGNHVTPADSLRGQTLGLLALPSFFCHSEWASAREESAFQLFAAASLDIPQVVKNMCGFSRLLINASR
jgi:hypothetical protein